LFATNFLGLQKEILCAHHALSLIREKHYNIYLKKFNQEARLAWNQRRIKNLRRSTQKTKIRRHGSVLIMQQENWHIRLRVQMRIFFLHET